ncbi:SDR family NAD(P)-dependent oxidoreductase [Sodalis glossinidius]|uniref:SDR family NAD(P)-dependent oxidoreductase n=1 Tax=Sodalis glossinidius TaxID=63612 RepID=UPI0002FEE475|nr:SDR family NAD(P)-dependent oxidoreductase [Sodalis glossinidius]
MDPKPIYDDPDYRAGGKLQGKIAIVTGGDSGIGRPVAVAFAKEGANVAIVYLSEDSDAEQTRQAVEGYGAQALLIRGDLGEVVFSAQLIKATLAHFGKLDILVNVAGEQHPQADFAAITPQQLAQTFRTNIFSLFYLCQAGLQLSQTSNCSRRNASAASS